MTREKKKQFRQSRNACLIVAVPYMSWRISFQGPLSRTPLFAIALKYELCSRQAAKTKDTLLKSWQNSTIKGCRSFCRNMRYEHYSMSRTSWMDLLAKYAWCRIGRKKVPGLTRIRQIASTGSYTLCHILTEHVVPDLKSIDLHAWTSVLAWGLFGQWLEHSYNMGCGCLWLPVLHLQDAQSIPWLDVSTHTHDKSQFSFQYRAI